MIIETLKAILYGIVEGITEWLPVSSTGHLILLEELIPLSVAPELGERFAAEYFSMFEVVIQLGAIFAVVIMFFGRLNPFSPSKSACQKKETWILWVKIVIASVPSAFIGLVVDKILEKVSGKDIGGWIYNWQTVATTLIIYGILFIVVERSQRNNEPSVNTTDGISFSQAAVIGGFQALAIIPGTSRSGATVLGSRFLGISRSAAAEFSFFIGIPAMAGASLLKGYSFFEFVWDAKITVPPVAWLSLIVASVVAFAVSTVAIRFLLAFVKRHSFAPFGVYRIVLGAIVIGYFLVR